MTSASHKVKNMDNFNSTTNSLYSPLNQEHLESHKMLFGLSSNEWAGFKQWQTDGRKVVKGAKGCRIMMVCDKKDAEGKKKQVVKSLYVFNKEHTEVV